MEFVGILKEKTGERSGVSAQGYAFKVATYEVHQVSQYPESMVFEVMDGAHGAIAEWDALVGQVVKVQFSVTIREYNGRRFNSFRPWRITVADGGQQGMAAAAVQQQTEQEATAGGGQQQAGQEQQKAQKAPEEGQGEVDWDEMAKGQQGAPAAKPQGAEGEGPQGAPAAKPQDTGGEGQQGAPAARPQGTEATGVAEGKLPF